MGYDSHSVITVDLGGKNQQAMFTSLNRSHVDFFRPTKTGLQLEQNTCTCQAYFQFCLFLKIMPRTWVQKKNIYLKTLAEGAD